MKQYKGFRIYEDSDHDTLKRCFCAEMGGLCFRSYWYSDDSKRREALEYVKTQIDAAIEELTGPAIHSDGVDFTYYGYNPVRVNASIDKVVEWLRSNLTGASVTHIQADMKSTWTAYYKDYELTDTDITERNKRTKITEVRVYGKLRQTNFRITLAYSDFITITVDDVSCEPEADELAEALNVLESKKMMLETKNAAQ